jgi:condensin complex subunit 2
MSERLADFKFVNNVTSDKAAGLRYNAKDEDLDSEDEADFQRPPVDNDGDGMEVFNDGDVQEPVVAEPQDFFSGEDMGGDDYAGAYGGGDADYADASGEHGEIDGDGHDPSGVHPSGHTPFDPRRVPDEREIIMAMTNEGGASMMDYFDSSITKNWAGPEHWKLRKVIRKGTDTYRFLPF